jgi:nucleotide-binding universal stress UspA family protein
MHLGVVAKLACALFPVLGVPYFAPASRAESRSEEINMLKRILVALTGTPGGVTAVQLAIDLARAHEARLTGITLVNPRKIRNVGSIPIGAGAAAKELREHRMAVVREQMDEAIQQFRSDCQAADVDHRVAIEEGDPCSLLIDRSRYHDLVAFGVPGILAFGHPSQSQGLLGPLVTNGVRPLLAVAAEYRPVRRVMIAYSGSRESAKAMRRFAQIDPWPGVTLDIVTFNQPEPAARTLLEDAADYCEDRGFEVRTARSPSKPREGILQYAAEHDVDLIVMGYSVRTKLARKLMGENGLHVLQHTERSVFLSQ